MISFINKIKKILGLVKKDNNSNLSTSDELESVHKNINNIPNQELYLDYERITRQKEESLQKEDIDMLNVVFKGLYQHVEENGSRITTDKEIRMTPRDINDKKEMNSIYEPDGIFINNAKKRDPFELKNCLICGEEIIDNRTWANSHTIPRSSLKNISNKDGARGTLTLYPKNHEDRIQKYRNDGVLKQVDIEQAGTFKLICSNKNPRNKNDKWCEKDKFFESKVNDLNHGYSPKDYTDIAQTILLKDIQDTLNSTYIESLEFDLYNSNRKRMHSEYSTYKIQKMQDEINEVKILDKNISYDFKKIWDSKDTHDNGVDINACIMLTSCYLWEGNIVKNKGKHRECFLICFPNSEIKRSRCVIFGKGTNALKLKNHFDTLSNDEKLAEFLLMAMVSNGLFALPNDSKFIDFLNKEGFSYLSEFKGEKDVRRIMPREHYINDVKSKISLLSFDS